MAKTSLSELKFEDCKAGGTFYLARDEKYRGFLTLHHEGEDIQRVLDQFETFKKVVDGEIKAKVVDDQL